MKDITKKYTNGEVTVVWKPNECVHSTICFKGLNKVFDPQKRPWVTPEGGTTQQIVDQIKKCPSGALSYFMNDQAEADTLEVKPETIVETTPNGPLMVYGNVFIKDSTGNLTRKNNVTAFCRCGASSNKPFCDGSHKRIGFEG